MSAQPRGLPTRFSVVLYFLGLAQWCMCGGGGEVGGKTELLEEGGCVPKEPSSFSGSVALVESFPPLICVSL